MTTQLTAHLGAGGELVQTGARSERRCGAEVFITLADQPIPDDAEGVWLRCHRWTPWRPGGRPRAAPRRTSGDSQVTTACHGGPVPPRQRPPAP